MTSLHSTWTDQQSSINHQSQSPSTRPPSYISTAVTTLCTDNPALRSTGEFQEFFYELENAGKPYLKVTLLANGKLAQHQPTIVQGTRLNATVEVYWGKGDDVLSVTGTVQGKVIYGSHEGGGKSLTFLRLVRELYSRQPGSKKPSGDFSWSFDMDLPKEVTLGVSEASDETRIFPLPQTTQERQSRASTVYEIIFQVIRGKFKTNKELSFPFNYIPITPPPTLPMMVQTAYQEGTHLPSPSADPSSWFSLDQVQIKGELSSQKSVDIGCTLFLRKPLAYTRGTVIPLYVQFEGADRESLQLLGSPKAILVCLKRSVNTHPIPTKKTAEIHIWKPLSNYSRPAKWEPVTEDDCSHGKGGQALRLALRGEIPLSLNLIPTTCIGHFTIDYSVIMVTPAIPGFESSEANPSQNLASKDIQIVTAYAGGPRPRRMLPPSNEPLEEVFQYRGKDFTLQYKVSL